MKKKTQKFTLSAMLIAIGMVLPFLTGQIPQIGNMLCPMHMPVFLCGLICGWPYGMAVGFVLPVLRSVIFGMPMLYPSAISMAFELATYGFVSGFLYNRSRWQCIIALYRSLILAMISGRIVWGVVQTILLGIGGNMADVHGGSSIQCGCRYYSSACTYSGIDVGITSYGSGKTS